MNKILIGTYIFLITIIFTSIPNVSGAKDTYYIYVDDLPSWADNAGNAVYEATEFWKEGNDWLNFYEAQSPSEADIHFQWVKEFGTETVGHAVDQWFVEVGLGDSNCYKNWQPFSANYVTYITSHEIGHVLGLDHNDDPDSIMYPILYNLEYGIVEQEYTLTENYATFIGFCTIKEITTLDYWVEVDDPSYGFDVYVVPSVDSLDNWADGESFQIYDGEECSAEGYLAIGGTCEGISQGSGLLVIMYSELTNPLTTLTVKMQEISTSKNYPQEKVTAKKPDLTETSDSIFLDSDNDLYLDDVDQCPFQPETFNDYLDLDGCPDTKPIPSTESQIPDWVRNIFVWYGDNEVSETELINAIKFLVERGIIKLD